MDQYHHDRTCRNIASTVVNVGIVSGWRLIAQKKMSRVMLEKQALMMKAQLSPQFLANSKAATDKTCGGPFKKE